MNCSIFWRLFWKEYRLQRAFWVSMVVLTGLLQLLVSGIVSSHERPALVFVVAVALPAFYALGCGATLFAGEQEAETYAFQRALPTGAWRVFVSKMTFALLSTALLFGVMLLLALALSGWHLPSSHDHITLWTTLGFLGLEMLLWATLFSLLLKRVLIVAILGVTAASVGAYLTTLHITGHAVTDQLVMETYAEALPWRMAIVAVVALADIWLGFRWFRQPRDRRSRSAQTVGGIDASARAATFPSRLLAPDRMATLWRLVWQQWRQSTSIMATIVAMIVLLVAVPQGVLFWDPLRRGESMNWFELAGKPLYLAALAAVPLLGACVFLADQRRNGFRFLTEHGVPPKYVWLSRLIVALTPLVFVLPVLLTCAYCFAPSRYVGSHGFVTYAVETMTFVLAYAAMALCAGQLCSMFFRSGLLAGLFSVPSTVLLTGWCGLMRLWGINWLWSVLPIPLALLLATRLRTHDWLLERNTPRAWLRPGLVLVVPTALLLTAVPLYRVHSVPLVDPGFSPADYDRPITPAEQATLSLYERAAQAFRPHERPTDEEVKQQEENPLLLTLTDKAWVDVNQDVIATMLKAGQGKLPCLFDAQFMHFYQMFRLLVCSAAKLDDEGKLDAALEQYLAAIHISVQWRGARSQWSGNIDEVETEVYARLPLWASRPNQAPERILDAIRRLEQLAESLPNGSDMIKNEHVRIRRCLLSGDPADVAKRAYDGQVPPLTLLWLHLPWERARALRLLDVLTQARLAQFRQAEYRALHELIQDPRQGARELKEPVEWPYALREAVYVPPIVYWPLWGDITIEYYAAIETRRRAVRLVLALEAWKLEHGSLPKTMDELVGAGLDRLPIDPFSGEPFHYFPEGVKLPLPLPPRTYEHAGKLAADTPFVWSVGRHVRRNANEDDFSRRYSIITYQWPDYTTRSPESEFDVWEAGWPFPIP